MVYPTSGSTLASNISTGLSTQIIIRVGTVTVGAIQKMSIAHNRNIERVKEVGLDGVLELVPNQPTTYDITVSRIVFDRLRLPESFARGFINIKSQLLPFEILVIDRTNGENDGIVTHKLVNCWFNKYTTNFDVSNYIITEDAGIYCEDIVSTLGNSDANAAIGGARNINYEVDTYGRERATDRGSNGYRGTMDVAGLINAAFE
jgi:hypothetical protein